MVLGIDIGGQSAKLGIVDKSGNIISKTSLPTNTQLSFPEFFNDLCSAIELVLFESNISISDLKGIGVGAPCGNYYSGCIENAANIKWSEGKPINIANALQEKYNIKTFLTNDANAAALGEMHYGAARGMKNFIVLTLGTGVGSGIIIDGKCLYGHDGLAGELGHVCIQHENGRPCGCGRYGCLETYTSALGLAHTARELLTKTSDNSILRSIPSDKLSAKDVYEAAILNDHIALETFNTTGKYLGRAMADFVAFSSPEAIILFGGLTKAGDFILNPIVKHLNDNLISFWKGKIKVLFSQLPDSDAAILGASALAW